MMSSVALLAIAFASWPVAALKPLAFEGRDPLIEISMMDSQLSLVSMTALILNQEQLSANILAEDAREEGAVDNTSSADAHQEPAAEKSLAEASAAKPASQAVANASKAAAVAGAEPVEAEHETTATEKNITVTVIVLSLGILAVVGYSLSSRWGSSS
mmetsp:Transcript_30816/g.67436  ORF Transcript_30816/g.67436 Transcript_30816/m.67436 type:complete len:158 (+) Transcript_30816:69-542(+)